jgi:hypothetical protein
MELRVKSLNMTMNGLTLQVARLPSTPHGSAHAGNGEARQYLYVKCCLHYQETCRSTRYLIIMQHVVTLLFFTKKKKVFFWSRNFNQPFTYLFESSHIE